MTNRVNNVTELNPQLREDLARVASTEFGVRVLRYIMDECGFLGASVAVDPVSREINIQATVYNEARRNIWLKLREFIPYEERVNVENPQPRRAALMEESYTLEDG